MARQTIYVGVVLLSDVEAHARPVFAAPDVPHADASVPRPRQQNVRQRMVPLQRPHKAVVTGERGEGDTGTRTATTTWRHE